MKRLLLVVLISAFVFNLLTSGDSRAAVIDKHTVLQQARKSYYNLRTLGLKEFRAQADPNWELVLEEHNLPPNSLREYHGIHFDVVLDSDGNMSVTHRFDHPFTDSFTIKQVNRTTKAFEQVVSGMFSRCWRSYVFDSLFEHPDSEYDMVDSAGQYWITWIGSETRVVTILSKDFVIREKITTKANSRATLIPKFERTEEGLIITSEEIKVETTSTRVASTALHVFLRFDHVDVQGLQLPHVVNFDGGEAIGKLEWTFSNYDVRMQ